VLGRDIQVKSTASHDTVREVESFVNDKLTEVAVSTRGVDTQAIAILTLMNIAEDYLALVKANNSNKRLDDERICRLMERVATVLK
jgi:cell division protein ZapA (FtsZ GTPase activity inhibitor)